MISGSRRVALVTHVEESDSDDTEKRAKQVNDYLLLRKVGTGSYGKVFHAVNVNTGESVAVKRIHLTEMTRTPSGIAQLEREIHMMRTLHHPNILRLHEVLFCQKTEFVYLVLELAELGSLGRYIDQKVKLPETATFSVIKQIAGALQYIHSMGYVHQDVKPWNILLTRDGRALLADFGIGHSFQSAGMVVGTPAFQAPEALADDSDSGETEPQEEDVWALGVTMYELLFQKLPFRGENLYEIVCDIKSRPVEIPAGTDPEAERLLKGMLQVDPDLRMRTQDVLASPVIAGAADLARDLPGIDGACRNEISAKDYAGKIVHETAQVCGSDFTFASLVLAKQPHVPQLPKSLSGGSFHLEHSESE